MGFIFSTENIQDNVKELGLAFMSFWKNFLFTCLILDLHFVIVYWGEFVAFSILFRGWHVALIFLVQNPVVENITKQITYQNREYNHPIHRNLHYTKCENSMIFLMHMKINQIYVHILHKKKLAP